MIDHFGRGFKLLGRGVAAEPEADRAARLFLAQADGRLVASGYIAAVTVDRTSFKPQPVPEGLREAVTAYEAQ